MAESLHQFGGLSLHPWTWIGRPSSTTLSLMGDYMDVSKNSGTPKWMVKIMENPIKMDDLGVPLLLETPI